MAAPKFLNSSTIPYSYLALTGGTDVASVITNFRTVVVTNLGWTEPSAGTFKTPPDASGKFFTITLVRTGATSLDFNFKDWRGTTLTNRACIHDATQATNIFATTRGFVIEFLRASPQLGIGQLLDATPDDDGEVENRLVATCRLTNAGADDGQGTAAGTLFAWDNGASTGLARGIYPWGSGFGNAVGIDGAGTLNYKEVLCWINQSGNGRHTGRMHHVLFCDLSLAFATDKTVPLDDAGATGVFRVLGFTTAAVNCRMMARKS